MSGTPRLIEAFGRNPRLLKIRRILEDEGEDDAAHDLDHSMRVAALALDLAGGDLPEEEVVAACLLHDLVAVAKASPLRASASEFSAARAETILADLGFQANASARIREAILDHSYSRGSTPIGLLARIVQDADRLDALGAIGIFRAIGTGERMGSVYYHGPDPWGEARGLDERRYVLDHFFTKLLRLPDLMNTEHGRTEARRRAAFMQIFLDQLASEIGTERARCRAGQRSEEIAA